MNFVSHAVPKSASLFRRGRNFDRSAKADLVSFRIDAEAFFRSFTEAACRATKQILILGWDTDTRTHLPWPEGFSSEHLTRDAPLELGSFLAALVRAHPKLSVRVLSWDFAFIYLFEREPLTANKFSLQGLDGEERLRWVLDREHPALASHHQKVVVIDDEIAFVGGLDLTQRRWDTPEHRGYDERRVDPGGHLYGPFHDVQMCVSGEAARRLGDLARERWQVATGETLLPARDASELAPEMWPPSARVDLRDVEIFLARTLPLGYNGLTKPVLEAERLFLDTIRAARKFVYIENQYFTSLTIARAIASRLSEIDGPEFVLVLPRDQTGWIEERTMGRLRSEALEVVERADVHGRFRSFHPYVPGLEVGYVKVHSKVMIVDDQFGRIGSANLNSRSMGLDTECDLAFEATGRKDVQEALTSLRCRLLAEHLGSTPEEVRHVHEETGSLVKTVERLNGGERGLSELKSSEQPGLHLPREWIDPSGPRGLRRWFGRRLRRSREEIALALIVLVISGLAFLTVFEKAHPFTLDASRIPSVPDRLRSAWVWTQSWKAESLAASLRALSSSGWAAPVAVLGFVAGTFILIPINVMILGLALAFPWAVALPLALAASLFSAVVFYALGRYWAWSKSRTLTRPWAQALSKQLARGGVWAVLVVRLAPVAPFAAVGLAAGGLRVKFSDYVLGTALGLLPGVCVLTWFSAAASNASEHRMLLFFWAFAAFFALAFLVRRLRCSNSAEL